MRIACVTGGTGCVGHNIIDQLLEHDNWHVIALHRKDSKTERLQYLHNNSNIELLEVDLYNFEDLKNKIPANVDAIFHSAANTSHWHKDWSEQWMDNVLVTSNLIKLATLKNIEKFIFTSTGATFNYRHSGEKGYFEIANEKSCYIKTKRICELKLIDSNLDFVILQPIIIVGPHDYNNYSKIFSLVKRMQQFSPVPDGCIEFCNAKDVAKAHVQAFYTGKSGHRYLLGGFYTSWLNVFKEIARLLRVREPYVSSSKLELNLYCLFFSMMSKITLQKPFMTKELLKLITPNTFTPHEYVRKSKNDLNYSPISVYISLRECYNWMVQKELI